jgi:hypothetical protein
MKECYEDQLKVKMLFKKCHMMLKLATFGMHTKQLPYVINNTDWKYHGRPKNYHSAMLEGGHIAERTDYEKSNKVDPEASWALKVLTFTTKFPYKHIMQTLPYNFSNRIHGACGEK